MARKGIGLGKGVLKVGDLVIDDRLKVGAVLYLADKYDKSFGEVMKIFTDKSIDETGKTINLIIALAIQHDPERTEAEVRKAITQLEIGELGNIAMELSATLLADVKNSKRPVAGNLQES